MSRRCFLLNLSVVITLSFFLAAVCAPAAVPNIQTEPSKTGYATQVHSQSDWEILVRKAQKESKVVIHGSPSGDTAGKLAKAFKNRYGVDIEFIAGRGAELTTKYFAERRAGLYLADIGLGSPGTFFNIIDPANIVVPLEPLLVLREVKDPAKWRTGKIPFLDSRKTIIAAVAIVSPSYAINAEMVRDHEISSLDDILAPKWKGKIVMHNPAISGAGTNWFTFVMTIAYGREKGMEYMRKLIDQQPVIIPDERLAVEWVAKGKYSVGVGLKSTILESFKNAGAPIKFITVKEGGPVTSGITNLYVYDKIPHPSAAKLFLNWILTKEAGEIVARASGYPSERVDVSRQSFDPSYLPGPNDVILAKDYFLAQGQMLKVSAEIFKDLLK